MSTDRDKELDAVQAELRKPVPHLERPDAITPEQGAMCFLDMHRVCGADCASYIGENPLPHERCLVLSSLSGIVLATHELLQIRKDRARNVVCPPPNIPPPDPFGGKRGKR
jgi:hypothetical protein